MCCDGPVRRSLLAMTLLVPLALSGCGSDDEGATTLRVYAAASLTSTFEEIAEQFESEHDGVEVELSLGGSSDLVAQIQEGAPADVFASADLANMEKLTAEGSLAVGGAMSLGLTVVMAGVCWTLFRTGWRLKS